jgi:hypothetical protein
MAKSLSVSDRHLRPAEGLQPSAQQGLQWVRIVVSRRWSASHSGQMLTSCLVNLLCRQVDLVGHIEVVAPVAPSKLLLPNGEQATRFPDCLSGIGTWAVDDKVTISVGRTSRQAHHTIYIGDVAPLDAAEPEGSLVAIGDGWKAWIGTADKAPRDILPAGANPLGPFLAAALAAGEVFKRTRGILRGRLLRMSGYSLWSGESSASWDALEDGLAIHGKTLPPLHVIGAGAVGNGFAYILANLGLSSGYVVAVDDDSYDTTNLNRCFLAGWCDLGHPKVNAVSAMLSAAKIDNCPFPKTIKGYVGGRPSNLRADVARQVDDLRFGVVVSCVDKGTARQDIQGLAPELLFGGSTLNLVARTNHYPQRAGAACLACYNPAERDGEKVHALEQKLRTMSVTDMAVYLQANDINPAIVQDYLERPRCGSLGEAAIRDLATRGTAEFSVGFVSLGAALLLASAVVRRLIFQEVAPKRPDMRSFNFLNGGLQDAWLSVDDNCEWKCKERLRAA